MKKLFQHSYLVLLILTCVIIVPATLILQSCSWNADVPDDEPTTTTTTTTATTTTTTTTAVSTTTTTTTAATTSSQPSKSTTSTTVAVEFPDANEKVSFSDILFIGDSRTVGLRDYGKTSDATFFCAVGLSSNNVRTKAVEVKGHGTISLPNLLETKSFKAVYIMLGINEIGGSLNGIANQYQSTINLIHEKQPEALVVVQSTLHVTAKRNADEVKKGGVFNNARINELNTKLAALANGTTVLYLDMNPMYDDADGCLMAQAAAGDGIHLKAKYYLLWRSYLDEHRVI